MGPPTPNARRPGAAVALLDHPYGPGGPDMPPAQHASRPAQPWRSPTALASQSVVAGDAVERGLGIAGGVLLAMAVDAPAHGQGRSSRLQADEVGEVVEEPWPGPSAHYPHLFNGAVAALAGDRGPHVGLVREVRELRDLEDAHPRDRLAAAGVLVDLGDLRIVLRADDSMTAHAPFDRRQAGVLRAARIGVTVLAIDLKRAGVDHVAEHDWLCRRPWHGHQRAGGLRTKRRVSERKPKRRGVHGPGPPPVGGEARGRGTVAAAAVAVAHHTVRDVELSS